MKTNEKIAQLVFRGRISINDVREDIRDDVQSEVEKLNTYSGSVQAAFSAIKERYKGE